MENIPIIHSVTITSH